MQSPVYWHRDSFDRQLRKSLTSFLDISLDTESQETEQLTSQVCFHNSIPNRTQRQSICNLCKMRRNYQANSSLQPNVH
jgi:flagellar motor switch protein FliM